MIEAGLLEKLERAEYWHLTPPQRGALWTKIIAQGLEVPEDEARKRISRNNRLAVEEQEESAFVYPRFNANASLLAQSSPEFRGPRGSRPYLASAANILRLSGISRRETVTYGIKLRKVAGGISRLLQDLELTAANPYQVVKGIGFSDEDVRSGIFIPRTIDAPVAQALGIIYANGNLSGESNLLLSSPIKNEKFYEKSVREAFSNAFNFSSNQNVRTASHAKTDLAPKGYKSIYLGYGSKALRTYLLHIHNFPRGRDERRQSGLSKPIKTMGKQLQDDFLKYYLGAAVAFDDGKGLTRISDVSAPLLKDIEEMIRARVTKDSVSFREGTMGEHFILSLSTIPAMELYIQGFLDINPRVKGEVEKFWNGGIGKRALGYLKRTYGRKFLV